MHYKIACPYCKHALSIKDPKAGKYKPKCSGCGEAFALVVEEGEPRKIKVGKLATAPSPSANLEATAPEQLSAPTLARVPGLEATLEQADFSKADSVSQGTEQTSFHESHPSVASPPASQDFSFDPKMEATAPSIAAAESANHPSSDEKPVANNASVPIANRLGGYRILRELGAGGMGSVYLAKQISLDRPCALKTIQAHWAKNPRVIARFIREAYAAAQLTHHNVVQIYDLGVDGGTNFFSMELVSGGSLDEQLKAKGKLPPKLAATLILQAARGLKFAHDHGMVHRDIKPANLMMTADGLVKVADMGLVKTPSAEDAAAAVGDEDVASMMLASARSQVTAIGSSMGTPAYMSPEQAADAASVDKRADIYSLGCTFYALLTGRPPFEGKTLIEVITKHRVEKITRPERVITGLPTALGDIIEKMTEKKPEDRYQDLEEVIHDLEVYLELRDPTPTISHLHASSTSDKPSSEGESPAQQSPRPPIKPTANAYGISPELSGQIQTSVKQFYSSPLILVRQFAPVAWYVLCGILCLMAILSAAGAAFGLIGQGARSVAANVEAALGTSSEAKPADAASQQAAVTGSSKTAELFQRMVFQWKFALGSLMVILISPLAAIAFAGSQNKSPMAAKWREAFIAGGIWEWLYWAFGALVALLASYYLGLWFALGVGAIFGIGAGAVYYFGIEQSLSQARKPSLDQTLSALRQWRLRGAEEPNIRQAVAEQAGQRWEEFFEAMFGYDAMRAMRTRLQSKQRSDLKRFRPRRDSWIDSWQAKIDDSKRSREEQVLSRAEKADMLAAGISEGEAAKRASAMAASMVDAAAETRQTMQEIAAGKLTDQAADAKRQRIKQMLAEARSGKISQREKRSRSLDRMLSQLLGSKFRFACAALLLLATGMWIKTNQAPLDSYWKQAKSTALSTMDSLKNTTLDAKGLENTTQAINEASQQAKQAVQASGNQKWNSVWFGLVHEKNVLFVAFAGILMLWGALMSGWRISAILVPLAIVVCLLPSYLW